MIDIFGKGDDFSKSLRIVRSHYLQIVKNSSVSSFTMKLFFFSLPVLPYVEPYVYDTRIEYKIIIFRSYNLLNNNNNNKVLLIVGKSVIILSRMLHYVA